MGKNKTAKKLSKDFKIKRKLKNKKNILEEDDTVEESLAEPSELQNRKSSIDISADKQDNRKSNIAKSNKETAQNIVPRNKTEIFDTGNSEEVQIKVKKPKKKNSNFEKEVVEEDIEKCEGLLENDNEQRKRKQPSKVASEDDSKISQVSKIKKNKRNKETTDYTVSKKNKIIIDNESEKIERQVINPEKNFFNEEEAEVKDEDIDKFCEDLDEKDNEQYENWVKIIENNFKLNKKKLKT